jgi:hypothetical protein
MKKCTQIKNMSATNPVSESPTSELTPAEAFWQTSTPSSTPSTSVRDPGTSSVWNREAWSKKRTPAEIARMEEMRDRARAAEEYSMMCMTPGCKMYNTFDKCEHNIVRMQQTMGRVY